MYGHGAPLPAMKCHLQILPQAGIGRVQEICLPRQCILWCLYTVVCQHQCYLGQMETFKMCLHVRNLALRTC